MLWLGLWWALGSAGLRRRPKGTAFGGWALVPRLTGEITSSGGSALAELACLSSDPEQPALAGMATAEALPDGVRVGWSDEDSTEVRFGPEGPTAR
ncbi:hypothetical protein NGB36_01075 [Streptomyces sp. RB6PN25]|uniref:Uncharacterized protein n=1 Tax=Streptomyces humicola TaxID=2953240 RepID=A0ABT1PNJ0_9ACTN|nr:hypothetical protein [Streptomyces humicola]MCQ4079239.1 hypothetical protein [Streptomyces humicola]